VLGSDVTLHYTYEQTETKMPGGTVVQVSAGG
jgi:hypothetical protein